MLKYLLQINLKNKQKGHKCVNFRQLNSFKVIKEDIYNLQMKCSKDKKLLLISKNMINSI